VLLAASGLVTSAAEPGPNERALDAAKTFGRALVHADASQLKSVLPERGKVRMRLTCLGIEDGSYSAGQAQALLADFLRHGAVSSFDVLRVESDDERYVLVRGRAGTKGSAQGQPRQVDVHLTLQPEDGRWVLSEVREAPP
jgi:hypothetical protein